MVQIIDNPPPFHHLESFHPNQIQIRVRHSQLQPSRNAIYWNDAYGYAETFREACEWAGSNLQPDDLKRKPTQFKCDSKFWYEFTDNFSITLQCSLSSADQLDQVNSVTEILEHRTCQSPRDINYIEKLAKKFPGVPVYVIPRSDPAFEFQNGKRYFWFICCAKTNEVILEEGVWCDHFPDFEQKIVNLRFCF